MGQEIGVSPLQLAAMTSTIANDGLWVPAHIVAATLPPQQAPRTVAFHPTQQRTVITPLAAAQMKQMMQGVVLHGTGKKAILEGFTSAGKTGTAQKVDPATRTYSRTKYIASFAGFAPVNAPQITVVVILDSPLGKHHGGDVGAPVFQRVAQAVLEYLHTPHDVELPANREVLLAKREVKEQDVEEGSPDRVGDSVEIADSGPVQPTPPSNQPKAVTVDGGVVQASVHEREAVREPSPISRQDSAASSEAAQPNLPVTGTVVLDVEQGGVVVPSFMGKSVRSAIELAQDTGLDLDALGSGVGREQLPVPGAHVAAGSKVTVKFGR
jgi:cell division protein FtsI (penicillin-binding protein 3)